jgi:hypothetical protein
LQHDDWIAGPGKVLFADRVAASEPELPVSPGLEQDRAVQVLDELEWAMQR